MPQGRQQGQPPPHLGHICRCQRGLLGAVTIDRWSCRLPQYPGQRTWIFGFEIGGQLGNGGGVKDGNDMKGIVKLFL